MNLLGANSSHSKRFSFIASLRRRKALRLMARLTFVKFVSVSDRVVANDSSETDQEEFVLGRFMTVVLITRWNRDQLFT